MASARALRVGTAAYPLVLPTWRDPRLHSAAVILSLQVLGQTVLNFELSVAQILVSILTAAVLEITITFRRQGVLMWPASALLTGNSVAFILRVPGTVHGDWWSLNGAPLFALTAAVSLLSKYLITIDGKHIFNPSNFGLALCFLAFGSRFAAPQDLWWGPMSPGLTVTLALIVIGGLLVVREVKMLALVLTFWAAFAGFMGVIALHGHCITARWHYGPVCGGSFWQLLVTSPEILVFMFFMMTDPRTAPPGQIGRLAYAVGLALCAALLIAPVRTEYATKVALLAALVILCGLQPLVRRWIPAPGSPRDHLLQWIRRRVAGLPADRPAWIERLAGPLAAFVVLFGLAGAAVDGAASFGATSEAAFLGAQGVALLHRPVIPLAPGAVPVAGVSGSAGRFAGGLSQAAASKLVTDAVEDLAIESAALRRLDAPMLASADVGGRLSELGGEIRSARSRGQVVVPAYHLTEAMVVLVSNPSMPQTPPSLAVHLKGTWTQTTIDTASGQALPNAGAQAYDRLLAVTRIGTIYLISADDSALPSQ